MIPWILTFLRLILASVFLLAGVEKVREPRLFVRQVAAYHVLPSALVKPLAYALPWGEILLAVTLLAGFEMKVSAGISTSLMVAFSLLIGINLVRGRKDIDCGCFGVRHPEKISLKLLGRDLLFLLFSLVLLRYGGGLLTLDEVDLAFKSFLLIDVGLMFFLPLLLIGSGVYLVFCLIRQLGRLLQLWVMEQP